MGDGEGRVRKPEALTLHIALDQIWGLEPALTGWGFCPRLWWKSGIPGVRYLRWLQPQVESGGLRVPLPWAQIWLEIGGGGGVETSGLCLLPPQLPPGVDPLGLSSPGRASKGRPCWRPRKKTLRGLREPLSPLPAWNSQKGARSVLPVPAMETETEPSVLWDMFMGSQRPPIFQGGSKSYTIRVAPGGSSVFF